MPEKARLLYDKGRVSGNETMKSDARKGKALV